MRFFRDGICGPIRRYCQYLRSIVSFPFRWLNCACSRALPKETDMARNKTAIVTGAQQGIGARLADGFLKSGYSVVATSLRARESLHGGRW